MLVRNLNVRILNAATGELIRELDINPDRYYQPLGRPPGPFEKPPANSATVACIVIVRSDGTLTAVVPSTTTMPRRGQDRSRRTGRPKIRASRP